MVEVFDDQVGEVGRMLADWLIGQGVDPVADEPFVVEGAE